MTRLLSAAGILLLLLGLLPLQSSGADEAQGWQVLLGPDAGLGAWRPPTKGWLEGGDAALDPKNERRLIVKPGKGVFVNGVHGRLPNLLSKQEFGDLEVHVEFLIPRHSNSGVKLQGLYEIQIFDSYGVKKPTAADSGGIYPRAELLPRYHHIDKGIPPRVNAARPAGQWQALDIIFRAPRFDAAGKKTANARFVRVVLNGQVVHENVELKTPTGNNWRLPETARGPLLLQADHGPVAFRNVRVRAPAADTRSTDELPWAFRTPVRPAIPAVKHTAWVRNPIDAFIAARLEKAGLGPAPEADRITLIRRVTFDLTGLPPTPEEVDVFLHDQRPDAYERLVDRLLASPRYGERWALYWLDLVRYAESDGFKADDPRPHAWRYRDYVIRAFNDDKPYDRFVREQLAGDELYPGDPEALAATAFNRHFPDEYNARNLVQRRQEILNDVTDTTGAVFLGLTLGCARCHNHKFDPISQNDYYRFQAFFAALSPRDDLCLARPDELHRYQEQEQRWQQETARLRQEREALEKPYLDKLIQRNKSKFAPELQHAYDLPAEQRTPLQQQLADMLVKQLLMGRQGMAGMMKPEVRKRWQELGKQLAALDHLKPPPLPVTMGVTDVGPVAPATFVLKRGNLNRKGAEVQPGFLSAIDLGPVKVTPQPGRRTTGRRAALALWLTRPDHPLTARVMVNRLWQHHFGRGIVGTPSDFGEQGERPTHPELLDWLATEFVAQGWSLKAMHRLMVTSATYRQASTASGGRKPPGTARPQRFEVPGSLRPPLAADPDNHLLWRMNRRRLEGEALRDAMLAVSGLLNSKMAGPSVFPELPTEMAGARGWKVTAEPKERNRRSVYVFAKRNLRYPLFSVFDAPDGNETCPRRHVSTNAPQALMLLNGKLTLDIARAFAGRVLRETEGKPEQVVRRACRLALGRLPDGQEEELMRAFLRQETALVRQRLRTRRPVALAVDAPAEGDAAFGGAVVELCHVLLNVNEFAYVD
jgi:hypothetical protein